MVAVTRKTMSATQQPSGSLMMSRCAVNLPDERTIVCQEENAWNKLIASKSPLKRSVTTMCSQMSHPAAISLRNSNTLQAQCTHFSLRAFVVAHQVIMIIDALFQPRGAEEKGTCGIYLCVFITPPNMPLSLIVDLCQLVDCQVLRHISGEEPESICSRTSVSSTKQHSHKLECGTALGTQPRFKLDNNLCSLCIASLFQLQAQPFV